MLLAFGDIWSTTDLRVFVERFRLKPLKASAVTAHTLGEWSGSVGGQVAFVRSRRITLPDALPGDSVQVVKLTVGNAAGGLLTEREVRFAGA